MPTVGPWGSVEGGLVEVVFIDGEPVVTNKSCQRVKSGELSDFRKRCRKENGLCMGVGKMKPFDVGNREGVIPLCREREK